MSDVWRFQIAGYWDTPPAFAIVACGEDTSRRAAIH